MSDGTLESTQIALDNASLTKKLAHFYEILWETRVAVARVLRELDDREKEFAIVFRQQREILKSQKELALLLEKERKAYDTDHKTVLAEAEATRKLAREALAELKSVRITAHLL